MFEAYLVRSGIVSADELVDALERQSRRRPPIGRLAVTLGKITMKQAFHIVSVQPVTKRRFGELTIELGYLTERDLENLLLEQVRLQPTLSQMLIEQGSLTPETLSDALADYYAGIDTDSATTADDEAQLVGCG